MIFSFIELAFHGIPLETWNQKKRIREKRKSMEKAAKNLDFMQAVKLRDDIKALQEQLA